jgi:cholinesterase
MHNGIVLSFLVSLANSKPLLPLIGVPIKTTSGVVTGIAGQNDASVSAYLGIPFAHPPIGSLRFAAPVKYTSSNARNATSYAKNCPGNLAQSNDTSGTSALSATTDDCLYLNVWAPAAKSGDTSKKAVLVWVHGGGFSEGGTSGSTYDGSRLAAKHDVVVVTTNYRLSIFGFPGSPGLIDQNMGLLDQRAAVEWVRDNIEAFGGDTKRIVLVRYWVKKFPNGKRANMFSLESLQGQIRSISILTLGQRIPSLWD